MPYYGKPWLVTSCARVQSERMYLPCSYVLLMHGGYCQYICEIEVHITPVLRNLTWYSVSYSILSQGMQKSTCVTGPTTHPMMWVKMSFSLSPFFPSSLQLRNMSGPKPSLPNTLGLNRPMRTSACTISLVRTSCLL